MANDPKERDNSDRVVASMEVGDRALLNELSTLNKQIAAFAWRLLDSELTAEEQLALVQRMKDIGEMICLRVEVSQNQAILPTTDER